VSGGVSLYISCLGEGGTNITPANADKRDSYDYIVPVDYLWDWLFFQLPVLLAI
jgi:hypothetical protein